MATKLALIVHLSPKFLSQKVLLFPEPTPLFNSKNLYEDLGLYTSPFLPLSFQLDISLCSQNIEEGALVLIFMMKWLLYNVVNWFTQ